ncbi:unnamed protein product [Cyprideis torosa]|uniref:Uncharacterized protein n=1 Tax=Cyprideis torosa TaxID=163714 RepID=A0A7R8ZGG8_9CRUS|nr:unnamed protein product [Cyprideis torosa]CAG0879999.1 unnamed protein product [Cyprideis torosa]
MTLWNFYWSVSSSDVVVRFCGGKSRQQTSKRRKRGSAGVESSAGVAEAPVPPDGGWGWVVLIAGVLINLIADGIMYSFGVLLPSLLESFPEEGSANVALLGGLMAGSWMMTGPVAAALTNTYGFRIVSVTGGILSSIGFLACYFLKSLWSLYIFYGLLAGFGIGMFLLPAVIAVSFYFERRRAIVTGLFFTGSGLGMFIFPPLVELMVQRYNWRGTMLVYSALILHCSSLGLLLRPLNPPSRVTKEIAEVTTKIEELREMRKRWLQEGSSTAKISFKDGRFHSGEVSGLDKTTSESPSPAGVTSSKKGLDDDILDAFPVKRELTELDIKKTVTFKDIPNSIDSLEDKRVPIPAQDTATIVKAKRLLSSSSLYSAQPRNWSLFTALANASVLLTDPDAAGTTAPLARKDVFYGGNLENLAEFQTARSLASYRSVVQIPTEDLPPAVQMGGCRIPKRITDVLLTVFNFKLMRSPTFLGLCFYSYSGTLGFIIPTNFIVDKLKEGGNPEWGSIALSVMGAVNVFGRVATGFVANLNLINPTWGMLVAHLAGAVFILICPFFDDSVTFIWIFSIVFGMSLASSVALRTIVLVHYLGLEHLTNAFGVTIFFQGIGGVVGLPIAGKLRDVTNSYNSSFFMASFLLGSSCVPLTMFLLMPKQFPQKIAGGASVTSRPRAKTAS